LNADGQHLRFNIGRLVGRLVSTLPKYVKRAEKHLGPIIRQRMKMEAEYGVDWPDKPVSPLKLGDNRLHTASQNDSITWLLEEATGEQRSMRNLILRLLMTNFVAMHSSSMVRICLRVSMHLTDFFVQAFTQALYYLAANPEYAVALREEVNAVVGEYGWTKAAVDRMYRIDSFIRESQRLDPVSTSEFNSACGSSKPPN